MDEQIKKNVASYFLYFYKLSTKWKLLIDKTVSPLETFKNKAEQLLHVRWAHVNEFRQSGEIRASVMYEIVLDIETELSTLKAILEQFNHSVQDLKKLLNILEKSTMNINWENPSLISGSALHPPLSELLQLAYNGWRIYNDLYQNYTNIIKSVDYHNARNIQKITFTISEQQTKQINEIIALTQYCYTDNNHVA